MQVYTLRMKMLADLRRLIGCSNISDLKFGRNLKDCREQFKYMELDQYSLEDVLDAFKYIYPDAEGINNIEDIKSYIKNV